MVDVKWIKIVTDVFDDEKILLIETLPDADSILVIWFKLLCLAGKQNNNGVFIMNGSIPYTGNMLATIFRRKQATVELALKTFEQFGMIEIIDNVITIPKWSKHQNFDKIEKNNEYMKNYMREYRNNQKLLAEGCKVNSKVNSKVNGKVNVSALDKNRIDKNRIDKNRIDKNNNTKSKTSFDELAEIYNSTCTNLASIKVKTEKRVNLVNKFNKQFKDETLDKWKEVCNIANNNDFLCGVNNNKEHLNWKANFDWLINVDNATKVLEGKYEDNFLNTMSRGLQNLTKIAMEIGDDE